MFGRSAVDRGQLAAAVAGKSGAVVWAVGHCLTSARREDIVAALAGFVNVTLIGSCVFSDTCSRESSKAPVHGRWRKRS